MPRGILRTLCGLVLLLLPVFSQAADIPDTSLSPLKFLVGEWKGADAEGKAHKIVYALSSGGTSLTETLTLMARREILFDLSVGAGTDTNAVREEVVPVLRERLTTLAADTGGHAFTDINDFGEAFRRVQRDLSAYYLIGYSSTTSRKRLVTRSSLRNSCSPAPVSMDRFASIWKRCRPCERCSTLMSA